MTERQLDHDQQLARALAASPRRVRRRRRDRPRCICTSSRAARIAGAGQMTADSSETRRRGDGDAEDRQPRHALRPEQVDHLQAGGGESQADRPSRECQQHALGQELPHDAASIGAERDADRDLALAGDAARQQQIGDVGAGDEQDAGDRRGQQRQRRPRRADDLLVQRHHAEGQAAVGRIQVGEIASQPRRQRVVSCCKSAGVRPDVSRPTTLKSSRLRACAAAGASGSGITGRPRRRCRPSHLVRQRKRGRKHADDLYAGR